MISYVKGELTEIGADYIVVEAAGIGYGIHVPASLPGDLPPCGDMVKIYTCFQVREDAMQLYGFLTRDDLAVFRMLLGVNGVGPKAAMAVLSVMSADDLRFAVMAGDDKAISKAPGMGRKTAQKVILELKDKISFQEIGQTSSLPAAAKAKAGDVMAETAEALTALGYSASDALRAVKSVDGAGDMDVETLLKKALARML